MIKTKTYKTGPIRTNTYIIWDENTKETAIIDPAGKIRLSRQAVLEGWTAEEAREKDRAGKSRGSGGGKRGGYRGGKSGNRR